MPSPPKKLYCICGSVACDELRWNILEKLPSDHPWKTRGEQGLHPIRRIAGNGKVQALRRSVVFHLNLSEEKAKLAKYRVSLTHWPPHILPTEGFLRLEVPFKDSFEARKNDKLAGFAGNRFYDNRNRLSVLLAKNEDLYDGMALNDGYVKAPVYTINDATYLYKSLTSSRANRTAAKHRSISDSVEPTTELIDGKSDDVAGFMDGDTASMLSRKYNSRPLSLLHSSRRSYDIYSGTVHYHPLIFREALSEDSLIQAVRQISHNNNYDCSALATNKQFFHCLLLLRISYKVDWLTLPIRNATLEICRCIGQGKVGCSNFRINSSSRRDNVGLCLPCGSAEQLHSRNSRRRQRRRRHSSEDRTAADSCVNVSLLSPESQLKRHANMKKLYQCSRKLVLKKELLIKETMNFRRDEDANAVNVVRKAFEHCVGDGAKQLKKDIIQVLLESSGGDCSKNDKEFTEFAESVINTMRNYCLELKGNSRQIRFDPHVTRTALGSWLRSPTSFRHMKANSIEIYPSERTLYRIQKQLKQDEGLFALVYAWFRDETQATKDQSPIVEILADELTFKTDFYCNIKDGSIAAFVASDDHDSIDLISELKALVSKKDTETASSDDQSVKALDSSVGQHVIAKKVNLFRIRTCYGVAENMEFFFNDGSLTGDEMLSQLLRCIICCETVGLRVYMICADAGGANSSLFTTLRGGRSLGKKTKLTDEYVSFRHPLFPDRRIYIVPCAVHGQKAMRNNLLKSQEEDVRGFLMDNVNFGWHQVIDIYEEDTEPRSSCLSKQSINPNKYSKMSVPEALAPFQYKTICFECCQLSLIHISEPTRPY